MREKQPGTLRRRLLTYLADVLSAGAQRLRRAAASGFDSRPRPDPPHTNAIEKLLARDSAPPVLATVRREIGGARILITGAAGSIGTELARQTARYGPATLVLLDQAETELFYLDLELRREFPDLRVVPAVSDITDRAAVQQVFQEYAPDHVFHAAAYKHVPLMQRNASEAIRNNVIGTWRVAESAGRHASTSFVLVSTDKAVHPACVMGATKRVAELVVRATGERHPATDYTTVRFGNVLGSRGSVLDVFRRQLGERRPLTVTHPDATRYFMTISEAVQLILQGSTLPEVRGGVAMLEMGDPIRILDLARHLLRASHLDDDTDEWIEFTGLRPGERLHEMLAAPDEELLPTSVASVNVVTPRDHQGSTFAIERVRWWSEALSQGRGDTVLGEIWSLCADHDRGAPAAAAVQAPQVS